jgi:hypothetical protein
MLNAEGVHRWPPACQVGRSGADRTLSGLLCVMLCNCRQSLACIVVCFVAQLLPEAGLHFVVLFVQFLLQAGLHCNALCYLCDCR